MTPDKDRIKTGWNQSRSRLKETWGRLSDEDLARENGDRDFVIAKVQEYYGYSKEDAEEKVRDFERSL